MKTQNRHKSKKIAAALAIVLLLSVFAANDAFIGTEASAQVSTNYIKRLKEEKAEYERKKQEVNERINALEFQRMTELDKKIILDERIMLTGLEISNLAETINQYNMLINEKEYEIIIAQNREAEQLQKYKARVRDMEENGVVSYLEIIIGSTSFIDLVARIDFISDVINADETRYAALQQARTATEAAKIELDGIKAELDEEHEKMEILEEELEEQLNEAHALILRLEAAIETEQEYLDMVLEEEARVQREIKVAEAVLRSQRQQQQQQQQQQSGTDGQQAQAQSQSSDQSSEDAGAQNEPTPVIGSGELMWPVGGQVISNYGMRSGRMHQGIDIGAPHGTPVVAADGGTVIASTYGSGYGNYVIISHGNGMTTLYAHLSTRSVSNGDSVSKGQQIGLVGSTGNATCSHLHFEVSVEGARINPTSKL